MIIGYFISESPPLYVENAVLILCFTNPAPDYETYESTADIILGIGNSSLIVLEAFDFG